LSGFNLDDYVDVSQRIDEFSAKYPDGSLQSELSYMGEPPGWLCVAQAYRTPDDPRPGVGHAFEPVPGKTPYTRDSEAQNAETAAWGRAIVALGFKTKKIASKQEVQARENGQEESAFKAPPPRGGTGEQASEAQVKKLRAITAKLVKSGALTEEQLNRAAGGEFHPSRLSKAEASDLIDRLERYEQSVGALA
jgi:hypothetical protein